MEYVDFKGTDQVLRKNEKEKSRREKAKEQKKKKSLQYPAWRNRGMVVRSQLIIPYQDCLQCSQYQDWGWQEGEGLVLCYFPSTTCLSSEPAQDPHWLLLWVMSLMLTGVSSSDPNVVHWSAVKLLHICCCLCHGLSITRAKAQGHFRHWAAKGDGAGVEMNT